ncbi:hypothetical protein DTL42_17195 [Bremerella cremea]|uniref:Uncharacterized protein n=1 Tax=Bremerella cremea TaxID=1031537 RepID=A0A368KN41_9BACT|nr:hypothetical protein [Bremerella cremea]RCS44658.1 hypothetical protein DTL42_17195 [Bremerella cremea]
MSWEYANPGNYGSNILHPKTKETVYRNEDGTRAIETSFAYEYHSSARRMKRITTTLPAIPTSQYGSGVAATTKVYQDEYGNVTWSMDERGYITRAGGIGRYGTRRGLQLRRTVTVRQEIHCHLIGYNIVRAAMIASALKFQRCPNRLSFTGSLQAIEEFAASLRRRSGRYREQWECVLRTIAELTVGDRPNRKEPRQIKSRPKPYKLLQSARTSIKTREATMS